MFKKTMLALGASLFLLSGIFAAVNSSEKAGDLKVLPTATPTKSPTASPTGSPSPSPDMPASPTPTVTPNL